MVTIEDVTCVNLLATLYEHRKDISKIKSYPNSVVIQSPIDSLVETNVYIVPGIKNIYVAFSTLSGESVVEILNDPRFRFNNTFSGYGIQKGLWLCWRGIAAAVAAEVMQLKLDFQNKKVIYCGHGIGGALATIGAASHKPSRLITFGSPLAFDKYPFQCFDQTSQVSYVNVCDYVPFLNQVENRRPVSILGKHEVINAYTKRMLLIELLNVFDKHKGHNIKNYRKKIRRLYAENVIN